MVLGPAAETGVRGSGAFLKTVDIRGVGKGQA